MQQIKEGLDLEAKKNIEAWLKGNFDPEMKQEILQLQKENPQELNDAFYTHLVFGTGGLRGVMGVGTNRMNKYTVGAATQGLANYILKQTSGQKKPAVFVGFDCRLHSREFAEETAKVLAGNGIEVYLYKELRPVALISFGVRYKHCIAGVMITASHNPPKYNGYKVYWSHGGQVLPPHDKGIIAEVNQIKDPSQIKIASFPNPLIHEVSEEIDSAYLSTIQKLQLHPGNDHTLGKDLHIVYTSLHGGGITIIPRALNEWGFSHQTIVERQKTPDGNFPTIKSPNPEEPATLKMGIETLENMKGDLLLATDPDVDRLAVVVMHEGKAERLNGNQTASLLLEFIFSSLIAVKQMPPKPMVVKTIVTTELLGAISEHYGAICVEVLTGFKYIGEKIEGWEKENGAQISSHHFIFGGEESFGYLYGTHVRDKDAVICAAVICELALFLKKQGKTLIDFLYEIYSRYGVYQEKLISLEFEGQEGTEKMKKIMDKLRASPPTQIGGNPVASVEDYLTRKVHFVATGHSEPLLLPRSDVIRLWLEDGTKLVVRPSGTEPKMKLYGGCVEKHHARQLAQIKKSIWDCNQRLENYLNIFKKDLY